MGVPAPDNYFRIEPYGSKVAVARGPSHVCNIWENMSQYLLHIGTFRPNTESGRHQVMHGIVIQSDTSEQGQ
jgi:hypothetical protein